MFAQELDRSHLQAALLTGVAGHRGQGLLFTLPGCSWSNPGDGTGQQQDKCSEFPPRWNMWKVYLLQPPQPASGANRDKAGAACGSGNQSSWQHRELRWSFFPKPPENRDTTPGCSPPAEAGAAQTTPERLIPGCPSREQPQLSPSPRPRAVHLLGRVPETGCTQVRDLGASRKLPAAAAALRLDSDKCEGAESL